MAALNTFVTLALEGEWNDIRAILVVAAGFVILVGSIYMLLASNFGAKVGYLITMVSLMAFTITIALIWLIGAPGTAAGTGPRAGKPSDKFLVATEPHWVPFLRDSEQYREFADVLDRFPEGFDALNEKSEKTYEGNISGRGEADALTTLIEHEMARLTRFRNESLPAEQQSDATKEGDWAFRLPGSEAITEEDQQTPIPPAIGYYQKDTPLLFGVTIPATDKHPEITVFAFRDKGRTFLYSLYFLIVGILGFIFHVWLLARHERRQKELEADAEVVLS